MLGVPALEISHPMHLGVRVESSYAAGNARAVGGGLAAHSRSKPLSSAWDVALEPGVSWRSVLQALRTDNLLSRIVFQWRAIEVAVNRLDAKTAAAHEVLQLSVQIPSHVE